jgi:hypothetical protein
MKKVCIALVVLSISTLFACKKNKEGRSQYPFVYLNDCISKTYSHDRVRLCFNSVVSDSRCPTNMLCIWQGAAIANFTFTKDNQDHSITLSTNPLNLPVSRDTTVDGYKIEFIDLQPYPVGGQNPPSPNVIKAEVKITRL